MTSTTLEKAGNMSLGQAVPCQEASHDDRRHMPESPTASDKGWLSMQMCNGSETLREASSSEYNPTGPYTQATRIAWSQRGIRGPGHLGTRTCYSTWTWPGERSRTSNGQPGLVGDVQCNPAVNGSSTISQGKGEEDPSPRYPSRLSGRHHLAVRHEDTEYSDM